MNRYLTKLSSMSDLDIAEKSKGEEDKAVKDYTSRLKEAKNPVLQKAIEHAIEEEKIHAKGFERAEENIEKKSEYKELRPGLMYDKTLKHGTLTREGAVDMVREEAKHRTKKYLGIGSAIGGGLGLGTSAFAALAAAADRKAGRGGPLPVSGKTKLALHGLSGLVGAGTGVIAGRILSQVKNRELARDPEYVKNTVKYKMLKAISEASK